MAQKKIEQQPKNTKKWFFIGLAILGFWIVSSIAAMFFSVNAGSYTGNVALIPVDGIITTDGHRSVFGDNIASSSLIVEQIRDAEEDSSIKAIVLQINSPGGGPVASEEIMLALKHAKKPTVAWIREMGTSGGYWIASSADTIVASRVSITGSVGVIASYVEFADLLTRYNMTYRRLTAGEYKDIANPLREMTDEEQNLMLDKLKKVHKVFLDSVTENRNLSDKAVEEISSGLIYTGEEAKEWGLVDVLGGQNEVKELLEQKLNTTVEFRKYEEPTSLLDVLSSLSSDAGFSMGRGIGSTFTQDTSGFQT